MRGQKGQFVAVLGKNLGQRHGSKKEMTENIGQFSYSSGEKYWSYCQ